MDIFFGGGGGGVHHKILGFFLCVNDFWGVAKISNIFEVLKKFLKILGGER